MNEIRVALKELADAVICYTPGFKELTDREIDAYVSNGVGGADLCQKARRALFLIDALAAADQADMMLGKKP